MQSKKKYLKKKIESQFPYYNCLVEKKFFNILIVQNMSTQIITVK